MTAVVDVEDATFGYGDRPVVEDVSLSVESGEFLGLVGPNGSGKSTLLSLVLGLRRPDSGSVRLFGEPAHEFGDGERVGYVAQNVGGTPARMPVTVREVVTMGRYPRVGVGRLSDADREAVRRAMATVGVDDLADRPIADLSGGQRQRAFIARALAGEADLLVLDEPAVGVDAESRSAFYDLLAGLNDEGLTIVLVEHDIGVVTGHATSVACINCSLRYHGDPEGFVESDALSRAYGANQRLLQHDHD
ncbi:metal ABC transporter ATP-binding protein [Halostella sp. JP-L12]|uniref:metal ABC transporter ATP-binding protein n=1 Tax=Halostella TaxID=1843185 RepID=UPI000EF782CA|nr:MULTISPECIES: metal ABC transporter ATP-binding protein [Halostella]NHN48308.1 metal ABC transporter ATP-binding protein [Halostella sp. JP-L12]